MTYNVVAPIGAHADALCSRKILPPFDPSVLDFIDAFSREILGNRSFHRFPELTAMAYWMRKAHLVKLRKEFEEKGKRRILLGRGLVFHVAPSNVDSIFIYSWFLSMLVGNSNVVRISEKPSLQMEALIDGINSICGGQHYSEVSERFMVVRYGHEEEVTAYFSSLCDMRVIWGGDSTIAAIRRIPVKPHASEITFADRTSMSLINAAAFLQARQKARIVGNFFNDAYWFNQMACSSPRVVAWVGADGDIERCREIFWRMLEEKVARERPPISTGSVVDKLVAAYSIAVHRQDIQIEKSCSNLMNRILFDTPGEVGNEPHCGSGLFFELKLGSIEELLPLLGKKMQTVTVFGFSREELAGFVLQHRPCGGDRFVPLGGALDFSPHWDGYDLLRQFCREVTIEVG